MILVHYMWCNLATDHWFRYFPFTRNLLAVWTLLFYINVRSYILQTLGTPNDNTMPGVTSNEEFSAYQSPVYRAEPFISIAPRYVWSRKKCQGYLCIVRPFGVGKRAYSSTVLWLSKPVLFTINHAQFLPYLWLCQFGDIFWSVCCLIAVASMWYLPRIVCCRFDGDAADLFSKLLLYDKDKRMVADPAMSHSYFRSLTRGAVTLLPRKSSV